MNTAELKAHAERLQIPLRNVKQAKRALAAAKKQDSDVIFAQAMYNHGRLDEEARAFVAKYLNDALKKNCAA